jgi:alcohol dehydrogenase
MHTMKAVVFQGANRVAVEEVTRPRARTGEAVIRITTTAICSTDLRIINGDYPVRPGLVLGHHPVGVIAELGDGLHDRYTVGDRVIAGAMTPCGQCPSCLSDRHEPCDDATGGWRIGHTINGTWAEYVLVPDARANLAPIPAGLTDDDVLLCPDAFSTGLAAAERADIRVGDSVAVFMEGPIGLCATLGARLKGASLIIGIDAMGDRLEVARRFGATVTLNTWDVDPVPEIRRLTDNRGVDVALDASGRQATFDRALRSLTRDGTIATVGLHEGKISTPYEAFYASLGDHRVVAARAAGGKERMRASARRPVRPRDARLRPRRHQRRARPARQRARGRRDGRAASRRETRTADPGVGGRRRVR